MQVIVNLIVSFILASRRPYLAEKNYFIVLGKAFDDYQFLEEIRMTIVRI